MTTATKRHDLDALVDGAVNGDQQAWNSIVDEFQPLVISVARRYRLPEADAQEISQMVWLKLLENLPRLRTPAALPGWIVTTTKHQAFQVLHARARTVSVDAVETYAGNARDMVDDTDVADDLLRAERARAVRGGLAELTSDQRALLLLLVAEPPLSYEEISRRLGIPVGSIGPTRARHLKKLRETTAMRAYRESLT